MGTIGVDGSDRDRICCPGNSAICGEDMEDLREGLSFLPFASTMGDELDFEMDVERDEGGALLGRREKIEKSVRKKRVGGVILTKMGTAATIQRGLPTVKSRESVIGAIFHRTNDSDK